MPLPVQRLLVVYIAVATGAVASCQGSSQQRAATAAAPIADNAHALHNLHRLNDRIISGGMPDSLAAFDQLQALGVRTIISVDGATPDVATAEARGMRYVHVPITYARVTAAQQAIISRAIRDLPGPVYLHCHHGKHRGPAAVASAGVALGMLTPDEGVAFMKTAGTAPNYQGLYECVANATVLDKAALDAAPDDFPSVHKVHGMTAAMVQVDQAFEHLGEIRAAAWKTPLDHPDLVPAAEAGLLADHLRIAGEDPRVVALGDDFIARLKSAEGLASALEQAIVRSASAEELEAAYRAVNTSCKDCHAVHRDNARP